MSEPFITEYHGWTITVWMYDTKIWNYIMSNGNLYHSGHVFATNRVEAVKNAIDDAEID